MAVTTASTYSNIILNEVLREGALRALLPKAVALQFCNKDSIDGAPSLTVEYPVNSDLGAAAAATEGVDFSTTTTLSLGTSVSVTPTEAAVARADITSRALRRRVPGVSNDALFDRLMAGDMSQILPLLGEEAARLANMVVEKAEADLCALYDDASRTVGTSTSDLTIANMLTAIYKMKEGEPEHESWVFAMHPQQTLDIQTVLLDAGTGGDGPAWYQQADAGMINMLPDNQRTGFRGSFLGVPYYETSPSVNILPNTGADVAGALLAVGVGRPGAGAQNGAHVFVEGHPMRFVLDLDASARTVELLCIWEYGVAELRDLHYVSIVTDAP